MELAQDKLDLIQTIIRNDRKFSGNEDLYDDFLNEACEKSFRIVSSVTTPDILQAYLKRIVTTAILNVLKNEGRLRRTRDGYHTVQTISIDETQNSDCIDYSSINIIYEPIDIKDTPEDTFAKKEILQSIVDAVYDIDRIYPEKEYLRLYSLRFENSLTQKEIAQEMNLSQSEVSKRLFKLMNEVKQTFR